MENETETLIQKFEKEIVVLIAIQHLGQSTLEEIKEYTSKLKDLSGQNFDLQLRSIKKYATILQKKNLVSSNYRNTEDDQVLVFNMSKGYVKLPEVAQIKDVVKDESLKVFLEKLENKGGVKKPKNQYNNFIAKIVWTVVDGVAGFFPNKDEVNVHYRNEDNEIIFFPNHFRQYIRKNLSKANKSQYVVDLFGFTYGKAILNGSKPYVDKHFVLVRGDIREQSGGAGLKGVEILPKGTLIETEFSVPESEFTQEQLKSFLSLIGKYGSSGFGAYSSRWGKLNLNNVEVINVK